MNPQLTSGASGLAHPVASFGASLKAFSISHPMILAFAGGMVLGVVLVAGLCHRKKQK